MRLAVAVILVGLAGCRPQDAPKVGVKGDVPDPPPPETRPKVYKLADLPALPPAERDAVLDENRYYFRENDPELLDWYAKLVAPRLVAHLTGPEPKRRLDTATDLATRVTYAVNPSRRSALLDVLTNAGVKLSGPADLDRFVDRVATLTALLDAVAGALADPDPAVREQAGQALVALGPRAGAALPAVRRHLAGPDPLVRVAAAEVLWWTSRDAAALAAGLEPALRDPNPAASRAALLALAYAGGARPLANSELAAVQLARAEVTSWGRREKVDPTRVRALLAPSDHLQAEDGELDRLLAGAGKRLLPALVASAAYAPHQSDAVGVLSRAPTAVAAALKDPPGRGNPVLLEAAGKVIGGHPDPAVRLRLLDEVQGAGPAGVPAVSAVTGVLAHPDPRVRRRAAEVLGGLGPAARSAVPALVRALRDDDLDARYAAGQALRAVDPESAKKALVP